jgi:hypothetical protein
LTLLTKNSSISGADRDICPIRMDTHYLSAPIIMGINQRGLIMGKFTTKDLTQDRLKELLHYCPETGVFTWIKTNGSRGKKGNIAGSINPIGYLDIGVDSKVYKAHRLAFLYVEGYFPEYGLDHINRNKSDNRWSNLRQVSQTCNMRNVKKRKNNTSGVVGVCWDSARCLWKSQIHINYKNMRLGTYESFEEAVKARWNAEKKYNFPNCNSTSSAFTYLTGKCIIQNVETAPN